MNLWCRQIDLDGLKRRHDYLILANRTTDVNNLYPSSDFEGQAAWGWGGGGVEGEGFDYEVLAGDGEAIGDGLEDEGFV